MIPSTSTVLIRASWHVKVSILLSRTAIGLCALSTGLTHVQAVLLAGADVLISAAQRARLNGR